MSERPYRIGITGTVAAGKSVVGRLFESWGAERIDSDALAREAVLPGSTALERIRGIWGDVVLGPDGALDRRAMARIVFEDEDARARLEGILHPEIRALRARRLSRAQATGTEVVVEEVPLLFESGLEADYDVIITVDAPESVRAARAVETRGWTRETFDAVEASQLAPEDKRRRADYVIDNGDDLEALERTALDVWRHTGGSDSTDVSNARVDASREGA